MLGGLTRICEYSIKMDLREIDWDIVVNKTGSGSCQMLGFAITNFES